MTKIQITGMVFILFSLLAFIAVRIQGVHMTEGEIFMEYWPQVLSSVVTALVGVLMVKIGANDIPRPTRTTSADGSKGE